MKRIIIIVKHSIRTENNPSIVIVMVTESHVSRVSIFFWLLSTTPRSAYLWNQSPIFPLNIYYIEQLFSFSLLQIIPGRISYISMKMNRMYNMYSINIEKYWIICCRVGETDWAIVFVCVFVNTVFISFWGEPVHRWYLPEEKEAPTEEYRWCINYKSSVRNFSEHKNCRIYFNVQSTILIGLSNHEFIPIRIVHQWANSDENGVVFLCICAFVVLSNM